MNIVRFEIDRPKSLLLNVSTGPDRTLNWSVEGALEMQKCDPIYSIPIRVFGSNAPQTEIHIANLEIYLLTRNTSESWFKCDTETPFLYTFINEFAPFGTIKSQFLSSNASPEGEHIVAAFTRIQILPKYRNQGLGTSIIAVLPQVAQLCVGIPPTELSDANIDFLSISTFHVSDKQRAADWLTPLGYSWASKRNHRWLIRRTAADPNSAAL